jgi:RNA polymerase sigma factor (sigma-70 family)
MPHPADTCWTLVRGAAAGAPRDREEFVRRYAPAVGAYLGARWRGSPLRSEVEDASQEVFLECFRGALARAEGGRDGRFRPFLYGVARNVARRFEERRAREAPLRAGGDSALGELPAPGESPSRAFDRAWALGLFHEARERMALRARAAGAAALRRVEILRLRFQDDLPVRDIARTLGEEPERIHREYAAARQEFRRALEEVVAFHRPGPPEVVARECARLSSLFRVS